jgi:putative spermidine/putrescine transport system substrate-binding protein
MRNKVVMAVAIALILTLLWGCGATPEPEEPAEKPDFSGRQLVVTGWGGTWGDCMTEAVIEPFEQEFGAELTLALPGASTEILARLRAEKDNPSMDVVLIGGALESVAASEDLMETVDWATEVPNWNNLIPEAQAEPGYGPSIAMSGIGIAYNTEKMPFEPTSWLDFWDERVAEEGQVGVFNMDANYGLAMTAAINDALGGTKDNVDPAFEKWQELMRTHKPLVLQSTQDMVDALAQRDALMVLGPNSRAVAVAKEGLPVKIIYPKEGGFIWGNFAGIPKGSQNRDVAIAFINFFLDAEVQANWAMCVNYSPTNKNADLGTYQYKSALVVDNVFTLDWNWINTNRSAWIERWNTEVLPELNP